MKLPLALRSRIARVTPPPVRAAVRMAEATLLPPRRFVAFGLGAPRSGTMALADAFQPQFRAAHEPEFGATLDLACAFRDGGAERRTRRALRWRDRRMRHELEVSCVLSELGAPLAAEFPEARFILLIRDCYSWLDSILNKAMSSPGSGRGNWLTRLFEAEGSTDCRHDEPLRERRLLPLDSYLSYWARINALVESTIPRERLLVVRTGELAQQSRALGAHLGVEPPPASAFAQKNTAPLRHGVLDALDRGYLLDRFEAHAGELMQRHYPGLTFDDVRLERDPATKLELERLARELSGRVGGRS